MLKVPDPFRGKPDADQDTHTLLPALLCSRALTFGSILCDLTYRFAAHPPRTPAMNDTPWEQRLCWGSSMLNLQHRKSFWNIDVPLNICETDTLVGFMQYCLKYPSGKLNILCLTCPVATWHLMDLPRVLGEESRKEHSVWNFPFPCDLHKTLGTEIKGGFYPNPRVPIWSWRLSLFWAPSHLPSLVGSSF